MIHQLLVNYIYVQNELVDDQPIVYSSFEPIGGLVNGSVYYVISSDSEKFQLAGSPGMMQLN